MSDGKKTRGPRGTVTINPELCKGCGFCIEFCPSGVLAFSDTFNDKGYHTPQAARPSLHRLRPVRRLLSDFAIFGSLKEKVVA